ncbi:helix-turn-helix transcriptional regulator [Angustibacter sp. McL0619]|uniref:helix-turn-helix transcriptional regulator n=1 Tax=Angustibacter sp. McL0619 TaxID=3415676 RepID=UPI003CF90CE8
MGAALRTAFIGREAERGLLGVALADVVRAEPRLLLIRGDAGAGKSRLVDEWSAGLDDVTVLRGACQRLAATTLPYAPVVQALRPVAAGPLLDDWHPAAVTALSPVLAAAAPDPGPADRWRGAQVLELTLALLGELTQAGPVVLVLEDLHWADQATMDLLTFLAGNLSVERLLVVGTLRLDEPSQPAWLRTALALLGSLPRCSRLDLEALPDAAVRRIIKDVDAELGEDAVTALVRRAMGNPFFAEELARASGPGQPLPAALRDVLLVRHEMLPPDARKVVELACVLVDPVSHELLTRLLDLEDDELNVALRTALRDGMLRRRGNNEFVVRHALVQEAVYGELLPGERTTWHTKVAEQVAADPGLVGGPERASAVLAEHWQAAGRPDLAVGPLVRAARAAAVRRAPTDAARLWRSALELWPTDPGAQVDGLDRPAARLQLAAALRWGPEASDGVQTLHQTLIELDPTDDARRAQVLERLALHLNDCGWGADALVAAHEACLLAPRLRGRTGQSLAARCFATLGAILMVRGQYVESHGECQRALELSASADDLATTAYALAVEGVNRVVLDGPERAVATVRQALELSDRSGDVEATVRAWVNLTYVLENAGRWVEAVQAATSGLAVAERNGLSLTAGALLSANQATSLLACGKWVEARAVLEGLLAQASGPTSATSRSFLQAVLAEVLVEHGALDEAEQRLADVGPVDPGDVVTANQLVIASGALALEQGRPQVALLDVVRRQESTQDDPTTGLRMCALGLRALADLATLPPALRPAGSPSADVLVGYGDELDRQAETLAELAPWLPPCQTLLVVCRQELARARGTASAQGWADLATHCVAAGQPQLAGYAWLRQAEQSLAQRGPAAVTGPLRAAAQVLAPLGPGLLASWVLRLASVSRVAVDDLLQVPDQEQPDGVDGSTARGVLADLTVRERQVLGRIARGETNRQIGSALHITEKTASVHVSNILAKLQVHNRSEATAMVYRLGLDEEVML